MSTKKIANMVTKIVTVILLSFGIMFQNNCLAEEFLSDDSLKITVIGKVLRSTQSLTLTVDFSNSSAVELDETPPTITANGVNKISSTVDKNNNTLTVVWKGTAYDNILSINTKLVHTNKGGTASIGVIKVEASGGKDITNDVIVKVTPKEITNNFVPPPPVITPETAIIQISGVPPQTHGLVVKVAFDPAIVKLASNVSSDVTDSLVLTNATTQQIGIISTTKALPSSFNFVVPFIPVKNGTTFFLPQEVLDKIGGTVLSGVTASSDTDKITVILTPSTPATPVDSDITLENDTFTITLNSKVLNEISSLNISCEFDNDDIASITSDLKIEGNKIVQLFTDLLSDGSKTKNVISAVWSGNITDETLKITGMLKAGNTAGFTALKITKIEAGGGFDLTDDFTFTVNPEKITTTAKPLIASTVTPQEVNINVSDVPAGTKGLVVQITVDPSVIKLGSPYTFDVKGALVVSDSKSRGVGIITTSKELPPAFTIRVPLVGVSNGTSKFVVGNVFDKLGGSIITDAFAESNINFISVGAPGDSIPDDIENTPTCNNNKLTCDSGIPTCLSGDAPICGSAFGLSGDFSGPGCVDKSFSFFEVDDAYCSTTTMNFSPRVESCNKENLCPSNRRRFASCREDRVFCKCVCPFKFTRGLPSPRCLNNEPICSGDLIPTCEQESNSPICVNGKLLCGDEGGFIDLVDKVVCR